MFSKVVTESQQQLKLKTCFFKKGVFLYYTETQSRFRFHKELTSVFLDIRKLESCLKVHRVERPVSSCACCKVCRLIGKMLFFVDSYICASLLCAVL